MYYIVNNTWKWTHANEVSYDTASTIPNPSFWGEASAQTLTQPRKSQRVRAHRALLAFCSAPAFPSIPPEVVDEEKEKGAGGLGGWWLSLNDPVYFEKILISASGFFFSPLTKRSLKRRLSTSSCAACVMPQRTRRPRHIAAAKSLLIREMISARLVSTRFSHRSTYTSPR